MTETVLLVHSGDMYAWAWPYWYYYWHLRWKAGDHVDTVFVTEELPFPWPGVIQVQTGAGLKWSDGLGKILTALPPEVKYVIYQHEDYFMEEDTWTPDLLALIECVKRYDMKLLKCCGWWAGFMDDKHPMTESGITVRIRGKQEPIWTYPNESAYLTSHQTSIWDREFLFSTLFTGESPWAHEILGTQRLRDRNVPIYAYRGKCPIPYGETITHGKVRKGCQHWFDDADKEAKEWQKNLG